MKTLKKVDVKFIFLKEAPLPNFENMEDNVIYVLKDWGISEHKCLCGCGEIAALFVKPYEEDGWDFIDNGNDKHSITPSVLNTNCQNRSHYIITNNVATFV